ncbi:MAG: methionine synthase [Pseudomonadota bacterium]
MDKVRYFNNISIATPLAQIYRRLGYRKGVTDLSPRDRVEIENHIATARSLIRLQGASRRLPVLLEGKSTVKLPEQATFESRRLLKFLSGSDEILLMGATAGPDVMAAIQEDAAGRNVTRGVVLDATASETVDAALDWIMAGYNQTLRRQGKHLLPARYSAGYGDLALENQQTMFRLLGLGKIGVEITESCILVPEKSVTAITGITKQEKASDEKTEN